MIGTPPPTRDRFLAAIAERVSPDLVQAVFLFGPMRQGQVETGVAVLAVDRVPDIVADAVVTDIPIDAPSAVATDAVIPGEEVLADVPADIVPDAGIGAHIETVIEEVEAEEAAAADGDEEETEADGAEAVAEASAEEPVDASQTEDVSAPVVEPPVVLKRPMVLTARYRHTLKGPDRGKWELEILEQADAPLITIEMVVRGVQKRLDDGAEPERLDADALRAALAEGVWTPPQR